MIGKIILFIYYFHSCFREEFKHKVKEPGSESIILENDNLKVEFESLRGLLKVIFSLSACISRILFRHLKNNPLQINFQLSVESNQGLL